MNDQKDPKYGDAGDSECSLMLMSAIINSSGTRDASEVTREDLFGELARHIWDACSAGSFVPNKADSERFRIDLEKWVDVLELLSGASNFDYWLLRVKAKAAARRKIDDSENEIQSLLHINSFDDEELKKLAGNDGNDYRTWEECSKEAYEVYEQNKHGFSLSDDLEGITPLIRDFAPGMQLIIGAASGVGKTALSMQLAKNYRTLFISGEMSAYSLAVRHHGQLYSEASDKQGFRLTEDQQISDLDRRFVEHKIEELGHANWRYVTKALALSKIEALFSRAKKDGFECVVVDYLQLMKGVGKDRRNEVASLARGIKQAAQNEGLRDVLLCQVSRPEMGGKIIDPITVRVTLNRLKESGDIEESGDIILGAWGDEDYKKNGIFWIQDIKHRNGKIHNEIALKRIGPYFRVAHDHEIPAEEEKEKPTWL